MPLSANDSWLALIPTRSDASDNERPAKILNIRRWLGLLIVFTLKIVRINHFLLSVTMYDIIDSVLIKFCLILCPLFKKSFQLCFIFFGFYIIVHTAANEITLTVVVC